MRRIFLIIPLSAAVLIGLAAFKLSRRYEPMGPDDYAQPEPAPAFALADEHQRLIRFDQRFRGRQKVLIIFFDGTRGPEHSPIVAELRDRFADVNRTGAAVLAISAALPSLNRYGDNLERRRAAAPQPETELRYPFPLLSDIIEYDVHRRFGAYDTAANRPLESAFVVDRTGLIQYAHIGPERLGNIDDWIRELREVR